MLNLDNYPKVRAFTTTLNELVLNFPEEFCRGDANLFKCCTAVLDGLGPLSAEHLLLACVPRQYLALASCSKSIPVSAQRTLTLES